MGRAGLFVAAAILVGGLAGCDRSPAPADTRKAVDPAKLTPVATNDIGKAADLQETAISFGKTVYDANCALCHGADFKGVPEQHTPDLTDDYWMFTGDDVDSGGLVLFPSDVEKTVRYGIRSGHPMARNFADMPGLGAQAHNILNEQEIADAAEYVLKLSGQQADEQAVMRAASIWNDKGSCYDCHHADGVGNTAIGGIDLTKKEYFLYGSDKAAIIETIRSGRHGISPAFEGLLTPEEIKAVSVYVFAQGKQPPKP